MFLGSRIFRCMLLAVCFATAGTALAQRGGGGGGGRSMGGMGGGPMGGGMGGNQPNGMGSPGGFGSARRDNPPPNVREQSGTVSTMRGGLQLGPPGRWWDDKHFAKDLKLRPDQQKRMDSIFEQSKSSLLKSYENLQQEETHLEDLVHAKTLDENALFAQIDRVAQARANLEKTNTHYLYQIRNEMDSEQIARLEDHR